MWTGVRQVAIHAACRHGQWHEAGAARSLSLSAWSLSPSARSLSARSLSPSAWSLESFFLEPVSGFFWSQRHCLSPSQSPCFSKNMSQCFSLGARATAHVAQWFRRWQKVSQPGSSKTSLSELRRCFSSICLTVVKWKKEYYHHPDKNSNYLTLGYPVRPQTPLRHLAEAAKLLLCDFCYRCRGSLTICRFSNWRDVNIVATFGSCITE